MHINRFLGHMDSMSRSDRFDIEIRGPASIRSRGIRCTAVNIPSRTMTTTRHRMGGAYPDRPYVTGIEYENDVTCTFMLDSTYEDKQMMELWQSYMFDEAYNLQYPDSYHGQVIISQLGVDNQPVGGVAFSATEAAIQTFDVTFNYRTWSSAYENSPGGLLGGLFKKFSRKITSKLDKKINDKLFG